MHHLLVIQLNLPKNGAIHGKYGSIHGKYCFIHGIHAPIHGTFLPIHAKMNCIHKQEFLSPTIPWIMPNICGGRTFSDLNCSKFNLYCKILSKIRSNKT